MFEIILTSVITGAAVTWALFRFLRRKEQHSHPVSILIAILLLLASCAGSKHAGQYLVSIRAEKDTIQYVDSRAKVDSMISRALDGDLMGKRKPYFEIKNSEVFIYVEKKEAKR